MSTAQAAADDPLALLWGAARRWLADAFAAFGGPAAIAAALAYKARMAAARRLRALECFVMKLLLAEAATLEPPRPMTHAQAPPSGASRTRESQECVSLPGAAPPETWRVNFRFRIPDFAPARENHGPRIRDLGPPRLVTELFAGMARRAQLARLAAARAARAAKPAGERAQAKAWKLARRFEALRRMLANPRPHVRRLAAKLAALRDKAYAAALAIAARLPPRGETDPAAQHRADFLVWRAVAVYEPIASADTS
jgi:hypothetical protein